jgi:RNA polymerase sigma factor (sigma-70 family)
MRVILAKFNKKQIGAWPQCPIRKNPFFLSGLSKDRLDTHMTAPQETAHASIFPETRWSVVLRTGDSDVDRAYYALSRLCEDYWYPLYVYVRKRGYDHALAQDLTQDFFARLLEKQQVQKARQERGKFRTFLLVSMNHFLTNEWHRQQTLKRGGGKVSFFSELENADDRFSFEIVDPQKSADILFEEKWAVTLLQKALERLQKEWVESKRGEMFEALKSHLVGEVANISYRDTAGRMGVSEGSIKVAIHRMRQRLRELLHDEIAHTVEDPSQIHDEVRAFLKIFGGSEKSFM